MAKEEEKHVYHHENSGGAMGTAIAVIIVILVLALLFIFVIVPATQDTGSDVNIPGDINVDVNDRAMLWRAVLTIG